MSTGERHLPDPHAEVMTEPHIDGFVEPGGPIPEPGPDLDTPEPGWEPRPRSRYNSRGRSFVSGERDGDRLRVRYYRDVAANLLVAKVWFGPAAEGPPGHAHGGSIAAVLDEVMGGCAWLRGHTVVAGKLEVSFKVMLPLGTVVRVRTAVEVVSGRKVRVTGALVGPDGTVYAEGAGLFVELPPERFGAVGLRPAE